MIKLIVGEKGSGKTKAILDGANDAARTSKGNVAFLDKDNSKMLLLTYRIRLIDLSEHNIKNDNDLIYFIKGVLATDTDMAEIFIDGLLKITDKPLAELKNFFDSLEALSKASGTCFTLTVSCAKESLPAYLKELMVN